ncbi:IS5 family transposase [Terasakiella sp.]|uniref:IS5 family transposase n=1 Tax=Terasakiella sp. TaxID=2034861 RepID=UPI003AFFF1E3
MSDDEWLFFEPFLHAQGPKSGRPPSNHRLTLDGIFWIARTGAPWRDLPNYFGKWSSVYRQFRRWTLLGVWDVLLDALNDAKAVPDTVQMIDSTIIRAHHQAAGAKGGLKRGSRPFKRWLYVQNTPSNKCRRLANSSEISEGQTSDYKGYAPLMEWGGPDAKVLLADKGYDANSIRDDMEKRGGYAMIPMRKNRKEITPVDDFVYGLRNQVERCFNKLKNARRVATRYDKTMLSFLGFVQVTSIRVWVKYFVNRT